MPSSLPAVRPGASALRRPMPRALPLLAAALCTALACADATSHAADSRDKPTLTVIKRVDAAGDRGRFNLRVDGRVHARAVGDGGTTVAVPLDPGVHTVSETAAPGTRLADYTRTFKGACNAKARSS